MSLYVRSTIVTTLQITDTMSQKKRTPVSQKLAVKIQKATVDGSVSEGRTFLLQLVFH